MIKEVVEKVKVNESLHQEEQEIDIQRVDNQQDNLLEHQELKIVKEAESAVKKVIVNEPINQEEQEIDIQSVDNQQDIEHQALIKDTEPVVESLLNDSRDFAKDNDLLSQEKCNEDVHEKKILEVVAAERLAMDYIHVHPEWATIFPRWSILHEKKNKKKAQRSDVRVLCVRQWRLYAAYEAVMNDYATVFSCSQSVTNKNNATVYNGTSQSLHFRVNSSRPEVFDIVTQVLTTQLKDDGWVELPSDLGLKTTWNLLWTWSRPRINYDHLLVWQRVNHYPNSRYLTRKDLLARSIGRVVHLAGKESRAAFDILPQTFVMPQDYQKLVPAFFQEKDHLWIIKPVGLSRGRGIRIVSRIEDVRYSELVVVQKYIPNPLLLHGFKFDLRLYVLVTSFSPLEAYIYKSGFARVASRAFSDTATSAHDKFIHLTNASIQKNAPENPFIDSAFKDAEIHEAGGSKCNLEFLWKQLKISRPDINISDLWHSICEVILASLVCVDPHIPHQPNSFELFGYDVLIDEKLKPWLIEVNASPSMARPTTLDAQIKETLIRDTIRLLNPIPYDRKALVHILNRRLAAEEQGSLVHRQTAQNALASPTVLNADLNKILHRLKPRRYGELPHYLGAYTQLAPGQSFDKMRRLKRAVTKNCGVSSYYIE